ncbi:MAG: class I SAM-dependent methyltransferase [Hasllibacter sp.]
MADRTHPGFFDAVADTPRYGGDRKHTDRLNVRHRFVVDAVRDELRGARLLDLASHDGRWSYAYAAAGAASVHGVEGRQELIDMFAAYPATDFKANCTFERADIFDALERMVREGARFDVVAMLGILYHVTDHHRLLRLVRALEPRLVIVDSEFIARPNPVVQFGRERTDNPLNAIGHLAGQEVTLVGTPSHGFMAAAAETLGWTIQWADWTTVDRAERGFLWDYFRDKPKRRGTCYLRPVRND